jgi:hypothetical protein
MDQQIKKQWVEALRSGKYKQGTGHLRTGDNYCCLGVLCDLNEYTNWTPVCEMADEIVYELQPDKNELTYWPSGYIRDWAGISKDNEDHLIHLNDTLECNFNQIADYIENNL